MKTRLLIHDPLSILNTYLAGWNAHDADRAAASLDTDVEYYDVTVGESQRGAAAARDNVIAFFLAALPDLAWKMVGEPVVTGDTAAFRWVFEGTNTGAPFFEGSPATGARIALQGMTMIKVRSGKIVYQGDFYDALTLKKQLGLPG